MKPEFFKGVIKSFVNEINDCGFEYYESEDIKKYYKDVSKLLQHIKFVSDWSEEE